MDTAAFLARVVAPGNYIAIGYNKTPGKTGAFSHRFFPEDEVAQAAGFLKWAAGRGWDAYHAVASFRVAEPAGQDHQGRTKFHGERTQGNAQRLRCLWVDLDVVRQGDKKKAGAAFATQADAVAWLKGFLSATGLPRPNLLVNSGYGLHAYWILEDALTVAEWQPHADALAAALTRHGFTGDAGISIDSARILRPPGTANMKGATPAPVSVISAMSAGDYPNDLVLSKLAPYVGLLPSRGSRAAAAPSAQGVLTPGHTPSNGTAAALSGGTVSPLFSGATRAATATAMVAATSANVSPTARPREMARIAPQCLQVSASLSNHGDGDAYPLWYLGHLSLAHYCVDGASYVHALSDGDSRYVPADVDAAVAQIAAEHARKNHGPPSCAHYERARPGICAGCPHWGRINSPWELGVDDGDLPEGYRRAASGLEQRIRDKEGNLVWIPLIAGDVHSPVLDRLEPNGNALSFEYVRAGTTHHVYAIAANVSPDAAQIYRMFEPQGITLLPQSEIRFRGFLLAWIDKLRELRAERTEKLHSFGWAKDRMGGHTGFAVAGTVYRPDGREEATPGGDPAMVSWFTPHGALDPWKKAAALVCKGRPDLQVMVAAAFAAPLMRFTGERGVLVSGWSRQSGVGKSSAMKVGQAVWSSVSVMTTLDDTVNAVFKKIGDSRTMPCYWDEMQVNSENLAAVVKMVYQLTGGKGKGRMDANLNLRAVGEWETMLVAASNKPLMDFVSSVNEGTEAGALRVFEFSISTSATLNTKSGAKTIKAVEDNYGHAGREFAKFLSGNYDKAEKLVDAFRDAINSHFAAEQSERFYVAAMAAILAGAKLAAHVGLVPFDVPAMQEFLFREFAKLRAARSKDLMVTATGYDLEQVLGQFMSDHVGQKLVTTCFMKSGRGPGEFKAIWYPQDKRKVVAQVAVREKILRVDRVAFHEWARKKGYAYKDVLENMQQSWGAAVGRRVLGGGTPYGGGQIWCVDFDLSRAELRPYLYVEASTATDPEPPPQGGAASPAAALLPPITG